MEVSYDLKTAEIEGKEFIYPVTLMNFTPESYALWARSRRIPVASEATRQYLSTQLAYYRPNNILEV